MSGKGDNLNTTVGQMSSAATSSTSTHTSMESPPSATSSSPASMSPVSTIPSAKEVLLRAQQTKANSATTIKVSGYVCNNFYDGNESDLNISCI